MASQPTLSGFENAVGWRELLDMGHVLADTVIARHRREVTLTLSISEHEKGKIKCPKCGGKALRPLVSTFFSQTSRKS